MKSTSMTSPATFEAVGNGSYRYNFNVTERTETWEDEVERTCYDYEYVEIWAPVTCNKITQAVLTDLWPNDYEQKLVNEYNGVVLGIYTGEEAEEKTAKYTAFLNDRAEIKAQIDEAWPQIKEEFNF